MLEISGFHFQPPAGFLTEESTVGFRPLVKSGPAPSFIVQSKPLRRGATLEVLATEVLAELMQTLPNMKNASQSATTFADGGPGIVLAYTFTTQTGELRQYHALRIHNERVCSVILTVPSSQLNDSNAQSFMSAIASLKPVA
jgi:hypothetical protein